MADESFQDTCSDPGNVPGNTLRSLIRPKDMSPDGDAYGFNGADGADVETLPDGGVAVAMIGVAAPAVGGVSVTDAECSLTAIAEIARTRNAHGSLEETPESITSDVDDVPSVTGCHVLPSVDSSTW